MLLRYLFTPYAASSSLPKITYPTRKPAACWPPYLHKRKRSIPSTTYYRQSWVLEPDSLLHSRIACGSSQTQSGLGAAARPVLATDGDNNHATSDRSRRMVNHHTVQNAGLQRVPGLPHEETLRPRCRSEPSDQAIKRKSHIVLRRAGKARRYASIEISQEQGPACQSLRRSMRRRYHDAKPSQGPIVAVVIYGEHLAAGRMIDAACLTPYRC